jgi:hypothetical protein
MTGCHSHGYNLKVVREVYIYLVDFQKLAIPIIVILAISGIFSFFLAYNFYPKKNVNINVDAVVMNCWDQLLTNTKTWKPKNRL